ncbi:TPA: excinuclease ABC subunit C [Candidatus Nomurabacteria bacterium]|nr:excinuclease ABC subunit C [Candidatus Nomurabacteria bacterium]
MYYVYVLESLIDYNKYTGCTEDLKHRLYLHNTGKVESTKERKPFRIIYYEGCINKEDAYHRERYLKSSWGKRYLNNRLKQYFSNKENPVG